MIGKQHVYSNTWVEFFFFIQSDQILELEDLVVGPSVVASVAAVEKLHRHGFHEHRLEKADSAVSALEMTVIIETVDYSVTCLEKTGTATGWQLKI